MYFTSARKYDDRVFEVSEGSYEANVRDAYSKKQDLDQAENIVYKRFPEAKGEINYHI